MPCNAVHLYRKEAVNGPGPSPTIEHAQQPTRKKGRAGASRLSPTLNEPPKGGSSSKGLI